MSSVATQTPAMEPTAALHPPAPQTLRESGLSLDLVTQLVLKHLHFAGELSGMELATRLGLGFAVVEPAISPLSRLRMPCAMTVLPLPGGPYTNIERPAATAGPTWSSMRSLNTRCEYASCTVSRVTTWGAATR